MRRPQDCIDDAADLRAEQQVPGMIAFSDQLMAAGVERFGEYTQPTAQARFDGIRAIAFGIALSDAVFDRLQEPTGKLCPHLTDLSNVDVIDLHLGFVACSKCVPVLASMCSPWSEEPLCDVCGVLPTAEAAWHCKQRGLPVLRRMTFTLGPAAAFAHVCFDCRVFLEGS